MKIRKLYKIKRHQNIKEYYVINLKHNILLIFYKNQNNLIYHLYSNKRYSNFVYESNILFLYKKLEVYLFYRDMSNSIMIQKYNYLTELINNEIL